MATETESRVAAVVYNPIKVDKDLISTAIEAESAADGWNIVWFETSEDDPGQGPAREALDAGATVVIAAGGDGTVRAVAEVLRGTDAAIALLPSGTGNLLARNLSLTLGDLEHSVATAFGGTDRQIDVAVLNVTRPDGSRDSHAFLVMGGVGLDAKIMANTDPGLKKRVGWLAYAQALAVTLRDQNPLRAQYRFDGAQHRSAKAQAIIVGNCGSLPANILLLPDAVVDDGLLDIVVIKPESVRGWLQVIFKVFWENGVVRRVFGERLKNIDVAAVDYRQARKLEVRLNQPEEIELDGDPFGEAVRFTATVEPRALRLKVPAEADQGRN